VRLRRVRLPDGASATAVLDEAAGAWVAIGAAAAASGDPAFTGLPGDDVVAILAGGEETRERLRALCTAVRGSGAGRDHELAPLLPFQPVLMRAFANSERHWIQGARGLVRLNLPRALPAIRAVEAVTRRPFPAFRPGKLFYREPAFYLGNPLTFVPDGAEAPWPAYTNALDFELELGAVVVRPLRDATPREAREAIGGFVVVNDLSARDTQWRELRGGLFGPVIKTKTFASAMSAEVVSADEILPRVRELTATVTVNGEVWSRTSTADLRWGFEEMLAHAAAGEDVHAGELVSSGTLPDGCGLELDRWLRPGDDLELAIDGVGSVRNRIGSPSRISAS
jgi:2-keto-4-pentenoate hydratase/2-oxohepta-3-ene-1,7-dioic acid hydratase in catechol pathway